jgi:hypothetical protein
MSNGTAKQQQQPAEDGTPASAAADGATAAAAAAAGSSDKRGSATDGAAAAGDAPRLGKLAAMGYSTEPGDKELQVSNMPCNMYVTCYNNCCCVLRRSPNCMWYNGLLVFVDSLIRQYVIQVVCSLLRLPLNCRRISLQNLARQNPAALNRLSGFKVERAGYGSLEWLAPVDVRGVDLGDIISIERGELARFALLQTLLSNLGW